jgi:hypothetical protein
MFVQKTLLRRHRYRQLGIGDDDRLPELTVPLAERELWAFIAAKSFGSTRDALSPIARTATHA